MSRCKLRKMPRRVFRIAYSPRPEDFPANRAGCGGRCDVLRGSPSRRGRCSAGRATRVLTPPRSTERLSDRISRYCASARANVNVGDLTSPVKSVSPKFCRAKERGQLIRQSSAYGLASRVRERSWRRSFSASRSMVVVTHITFVRRVITHRA